MRQKLIPLDVLGNKKYVMIQAYDSLEELQDKLVRSGLVKYSVGMDVSAYCYTTAPDEQEDLLGTLYFTTYPTLSEVAHEATHLALSILAREGKKILPITYGHAPKVEEELCNIVGSLTNIIKSEVDLLN